MVILIINQDGVSAVEPECQPPIAVDRDCPMPGEVALQRVEFPAWGVHVVWANGSIQGVQLQSQPFLMSGLYASFAPGFKEPLNAFVYE